MFFKNADNLLYDSHAHINSHEFDKDVNSIVSKAQDASVQKIVDVGVNFESSKKSIELSKKFRGTVFSTVGIDPDVVLPISELYNSNLELSSIFDELSSLIEENRELVVGIGESGVDNFWLKKSALGVSEQESLLGKQIELLNVHIELARKFDLPLTLHSRGYEAELIEYLKNKGIRGIFHSYTGNYETASVILDSGFGLGINGIITFKNAEELRTMYKKVFGNQKITSPADLYTKNVYLETDAPYLSPNRGERNEPSQIATIFKFITENL